MKEYSADKSGAPQKDAERPGSEHATDERRPGELNPAGGEGRLAGAAWRFGRQGEASEVADRTEEGPVPRSRSRDSAMRHLNAKLVSKLLRSTGIDLSAVLLSTDPSLAEQGKAGAAVEGREIKVAPGNEENEEVLAHEAGHIIQQMPVGARAAREASPKEGAGSVEGQETAPVTGEPGGSGPSGESKGLEQDVDLEAEADSVAAAVLAGEAVEVRGVGSGVLYEEPETARDPNVAAPEIASDEAAGAGGGESEAQGEMLKALGSDAEKYEKKLAALAKDQEARARTAREGLDATFDIPKLAMLDGLDAGDAEVLEKSIAALKEEARSIRAGHAEAPRVQLFERFTDVRKELESTFESSNTARAKTGSDDASPTAEREDFGPAVKQAWEEITAGFQSAFDQAEKLPQEPREECRAALLAKYDEMSEKLWQLYSQEKTVEGASKGAKAEMEAITAESKGMVKNWLVAKMNDNAAKASANIDQGHVADGLASGAKAGAGAFDNAPYQSVEAVQAAQKKWLNQLEVAWELDKRTILNWATGNQDQEVQDVLYRMGRQNTAKSGATPAAGEDEVYSYEESRQSVQEAQKLQDDKGEFKLNAVELLLLSGSLEAKRHFEQMMAANPKPEGEKKLEIMGEESVYRNFHEQATKWRKKFAGEKPKPKNPAGQKTILSGDGVAAPGFSRHGYGAEYDLGDGTTREDRKPHKAQFDWLEQEAWRWGFFRPFKGEGKLSEDFKQLYGNELVAVTEEFWHWSYYPVSQALWELISVHMSDVEKDPETSEQHDIVKDFYSDLYDTHKPLTAAEVKQKKKEEKAKVENPSVRKVVEPPLESEMVSWVRKNVQMIHNGVNKEVGPEPKK